MYEIYLFFLRHTIPTTDILDIKMAKIILLDLDFSWQTFPKYPCKSSFKHKTCTYFEV